MKDHAAKWVILGLLVVVVGLPFLLRPASEGAASHAAGGGGLIIYTPHNDAIRYELARGFNDWRVSQGLAPVDFDWRTGGTSDLRRQVFDQFTTLVQQNREEQGIGVDLFFGGGEYDHNRLARGVTRDDTAIPLTVPAEIPDDAFNEAFPHETIGGEMLNHPEQRWTGVVLSSFGIVYNRPYLRAIDVPEPRTWSDLTNPDLFGAIALADPAHSGSITATYHSLMRRTGWVEGWHMLRRIYANARYFTASSTQVPIDVANGEAAAGMCIDFYGRYQAGSVGDDRVGYVDPPFMTAITADTISILRGAPHMETAQQFVRWMLTKEAQRLWQVKRGLPGGPVLYELRRQPIRADLFTADEKVNWTDPELDPFNSTRPMPADMPSFFDTIAAISHAMAIDIHDDIKAAWQAIIEEADPARRAAMEAEFDRFPPELTLVWPEGVESDWYAAIEDRSHPNHAVVTKTLEDFVTGVLARWSDPDQRDRDRLAWTLFFQQQYRKVVSMAQ